MEVTGEEIMFGNATNFCDAWLHMWMHKMFPFQHLSPHQHSQLLFRRCRSMLDWWCRFDRFSSYVARLKRLFKTEKKLLGSSDERKRTRPNGRVRGCDCTCYYNNLHFSLSLLRPEVVRLLVFLFRLHHQIGNYRILHDVVSRFLFLSQRISFIDCEVKKQPKCFSHLIAL